MNVIYGDDFVEISKSFLGGLRVTSKVSGARYEVPKPLALNFKRSWRALRRREAELYPRYYLAEAYLMAEFASLVAFPKGDEYESYIAVDPRLNAENAIWMSAQDRMTSVMIDQRGGFHLPTSRLDDHHRQARQTKVRHNVMGSVILGTVALAYAVEGLVPAGYMEVAAGIGVGIQLALLAFLPDRVATWWVPDIPRPSSYRKTQK